MCDQCASDPECRHPTCASKDGGCACTLQGPTRCPTCGHPCPPWWSGLGLTEGPAWVRDFLGGEGTESPGFDQYPATRAALLEAWRSRREDLLSDGETTIEDPAWLDAHLPDRTYRDVGEVFLALNPSLTGPALDARKWHARLPVRSVANGAHLRVPHGQTVLLVGASGQGLDVLAEGEHTLSPTNAPLAAGASRRAAPGSPLRVLEVAPIFFFTGELEAQVRHAARPPPMPPPAFSARVRFAIDDLGKLARSAAGRTLTSSTPELDRVLDAILQPTWAGIDPTTMGDHPRIEAILRSALGPAGIGVRSVQFEAGLPFGQPQGFPPGPGAGPGGPPGVPARRSSVGPPNGPPGGFPGLPPEVLARMPPEARAMMEARMKAAMASRAVPPGPPPHGPASPQVGSPPGVRTCARCRRPNPPTTSVCLACGAALGVA